uniref:Putative secreted protein n=1 Tax=Anopheles darlingi TaxID=43151 RepID=A0A2M4DLD6_ANODA
MLTRQFPQLLLLLLLLSSLTNEKRQKPIAKALARQHTRNTISRHSGKKAHLEQDEEALLSVSQLTLTP